MKRTLAKLRRRLILRALSRTAPATLDARSERRVMAAFRRAAKHAPAYRALLSEHGVDPREVRSFSDFQTLCPPLTKDDTFARFPVHELCAGGELEDVASVLTSSGQSGRFSFGLSSRAQTRRAAADVDLALQMIFGVDDRTTLVINCLPMGVRFASEAVTLADVSVREDMAIAIATDLGRYYDQTVFIGDPLFLKHLADTAADCGVDWSKRRVCFVVGEEVFGEHYRTYLARRFAMDPEGESGGIIVSSMGVGELGLNLFFETRATVRLRKLAHRDPSVAQMLFGDASVGGATPMLFAYDPTRTHVEILDPDERGVGKLAVSVTDLQSPIPLLRYCTGDLAMAVEPIASSAQLDPQPTDNLPVIAILGRQADLLDDGHHVSAYKDALFADPEVAPRVTGAFRMSRRPAEGIDVQLRRTFEPETRLRARLSTCMPGSLRPGQVRLWPYERFPFGMSVDYERKFSYLGGA